MNISDKVKNFCSYSTYDKLGVLSYKLSVLLSKARGHLSLAIGKSLLGVEIGNNCHAWGKVLFIRGAGSKIVLGNNVVAVSDSSRCASSSIYANVKLRTYGRTSGISIGNNVGLNGTSITARSTKIQIGNLTIIAPNVTIVDSDFHLAWPPENRNNNPGLESDKAVTIGENVWIGMGSIILKGVSIGDNSIVAAGSVVTKSFPSNVLIGGTPAKIIKVF